MQAVARKMRHIASLPRFNPLDPENIGSMLRAELERLPRQPFPHSPFRGPGLYALYYIGNLPMYSELKGTDTPIYVGKAEAGNSNIGNEPNYEQPKLTNRIAKHAKSVREVEESKGNLSLSDFEVRALSLDDAWIVLGERALLRAYRPVLWNSIVTGFGSNIPGSDRQNARSFWDTLHPGRRQAKSLPHRRFTYEEMVERTIKASQVSRMVENSERARLLEELLGRRPPYYWFPAKDGDPDRRIRVLDVARFKGELDRLGTQLEPTQVKLVSNDEIAEEDDVDSDDDVVE